MVVQYPHHLYVHNATDNSTQDDDGNIIDPQQGAAAWSELGPCREETNGRGSQVTTNDGRTIVYSSLIQIPRGNIRVTEGTEVMITERTLTSEELDGDIEALRASGVIRIKGRCLNFDTGSLHNRLWI